MYPNVVDEVFIVQRVSTNVNRAAKPIINKTMKKHIIFSQTVCAQ